MDQTLQLLLSAFVVLQIADVATTIKALNLKGTEESNPFLKYFMGKFGIGWVVVKVIIACAVAYYLFENQSYFGFIVLNIAYLIGVINNMVIISRRR